MQTQKLQIEYPSEDQEDWFSGFKAFVDTVDSRLYAQHEAAQTIMRGGGTRALSISTNTFSWSAALEFMVATTGRIYTVPSGGILLVVGESLYVTIPHPLTDNVANGTLAKDSAIGIDQNRFLVGIRRNNSVHMSDGTTVVGA